MQTHSVPETPGRAPVIPEETPTRPRPDMPAVDPSKDTPQDRPAHPDTPEDDGTPSPETPEALAIRVP